MGTPLRHLLKSKISSPLSPTVNKTSQIVNNVPLSKRLPRYGNSPNCRKSIATAFFDDVLQNSNKNSLIKHLQQANNSITIEITDFSQNVVNLNSPTKIEMLKNGLSNHKNLKVLGRGSFGSVVEGLYRGKHVAIKVLKLNKYKSLEKETNALNLNHENVTKVIEIISSCTSTYGIIVMEYSKFSRNLQTVLEDFTINVNQPDTIKYALDICKGLKYCHRNNIIHLDLKPSNILICKNNLVKLCDFGNSFKLDDCNQTQHTVCGTIPYAAPELLLGKFPTVKCDIYSLGIILWQMRYRQIPYEDLKEVEVITYKVVKLHCRPISKYQDEYSMLYSHCWSGNVLDRPGIDEVLILLYNLLKT